MNSENDCSTPSSIFLDLNCLNEDEGVAVLTQKLYDYAQEASQYSNSRRSKEFLITVFYGPLREAMLATVEDLNLSYHELPSKALLLIHITEETMANSEGLQEW